MLSLTVPPLSLRLMACYEWNRTLIVHGVIKKHVEYISSPKCLEEESKYQLPIDPPQEGR